MDNPNLYIISGCNGAVKTTASMTVLPDAIGSDFRIFSAYMLRLLIIGHCMTTALLNNQ